MPVTHSMLSIPGGAVTTVSRIKVPNNLVCFRSDSDVRLEVHVDLGLHYIWVGRGWSIAGDGCRMFSSR